MDGAGKMIWPLSSPQRGVLECGVYDLIMADPPWRFLTYSEKGKLKKSPEVHYPTMTLADIMAMPVSQLAKPNCYLWLWATAPMLLQGLDVMRAWGFRYTTMGVWHKKTVNGKTQFGTGYVLRSAAEPFLIGKIGDPKNTRGTRNLIEGLLREHSRKPEEAYRAAEAWMPGARRANLFACEIVPGWEGWGDEVGREYAGQFRIGTQRETSQAGGAAEQSQRC